MSTDIRAKLGWLGALTILVMCVNHPGWSLVILLTSCLVVVARRIRLSGFWSMIRYLLPLLALVLFCNGFTVAPDGFIHPENRTVLASLGPAQFTRGGLLAGANFVLRILTMVLATYAVWSTTNPDEVIDLTLAMRAPYSVNVLLTTALATIPTLQERSVQIRQAAQARGVRPPGRGAFGQLRAMIPLMIPLIATCLRMSDDMTIALTTRGYGSRSGMTQMRDLSMTGWDRIVCALALVVAIGAVVIRLTTTWGRL